MNIKTFGSVDERSLKQLERCMEAGDAESASKTIQKLRALEAQGVQFPRRVRDRYKVLLGEK